MNKFKVEFTNLQTTLTPARLADTIEERLKVSPAMVEWGVSVTVLRQNDAEVPVAPTQEAR